MKKFWFTALIAIGFWSCATGLGQMVTPAAAAPAADREYKLAVDDVLDITVDNHDDLNRTVTIRRDGKISLPLGPEVVAAGKTTGRLAAEIKHNFLKYLNNVEVDVALKEAHPQRARILGAVKSAGSYDIKANWRIMDLIAVAGGLTANPNRIAGRIVHADGSDADIDILAASKDMGSQANVPIGPEDLVFLNEQETVRQIHVIGQVKSPGAYDLDENLTLVGLIAEAGGPTDEAALRKVYVERNSQQLKFDLYKALTEGAPTTDMAAFQFEPGDTVVVPENRERVAIMGQVDKPGYYMLSEDKHAATVFRALALAGGQLPTADLQHAVITRNIGGSLTKIPVDLVALSRGDSANDPELEPDDLVYLPQSQVRVIGMVSKPGAYNINNQSTLVSVLADAGGLVAGAGASKAYVMRGDIQMPVDLHTVLSGTPDPAAVNFKLHNDDVLVIPDVTNQVQVTGEVLKPGLYNLDDTLTVASLLTNAGGVLFDGALNKAYVTRNGAKIPLTDGSLESESLKPVDIHFVFQPGDVLTVPINLVRFVVMGQARNQGYFYFPPGKREISIVDALSEAGGTTVYTDLRKSVLVRNGVATQLDLSGLTQQSKSKVPAMIIPGDVIYLQSKNPDNKMGLLSQTVLGAARLFLP